jgi:hypothetical protein
MRAAIAGTYYDDALVCGYNCSTWICLMEETYSLSGYGYQFHGWPDGKSLLEQEQCVVDVLKILLNEKIKDMNDA